MALPRASAGTQSGQARAGARGVVAPRLGAIQGEDGLQWVRDRTFGLRFLSPVSCIRDETDELLHHPGMERPSFIHPKPGYHLSRTLSHLACSLPLKPWPSHALEGSLPWPPPPASKSLFNRPHCPQEHKEEKLGRGWGGSGGRSQQSGPPLPPPWQGHTRREPSLKCVSLSHKRLPWRRSREAGPGAECGTMEAESAALTCYVSYRTPIVRGSF